MIYCLYLIVLACVLIDEKFIIIFADFLNL